jgi:hypothetical protein
MALIFNKDLGTSALLYSFNNNVVRFKSNTSGVTQTKATILTNGNTYTIYPDPAGDFYFNFKGIKSVELNVGNFAETINPDLAVSLVYNWTPKTILEETITFTVFLSNNTTETATRAVTWLNGYANLIDYKRNYPNLILDYSAFMLKPLPLLKYWPGLPFDFAFYANPASNFTLINNSASIDYTFTNTNKVPRLFFSDGRLDISIEDYVPLNEGFNSMTLTSGSTDITINWSLDETPPGISFSDLDLEIFVNGVRVVQKFTDDSGSFAAKKGDTILVKIFGAIVPTSGIGGGNIEITGLPTQRTTTYPLSIDTTFIAQGDITIKAYSTWSADTYSAIRSAVFIPATNANQKVTFTKTYTSTTSQAAAQALATADSGFTAEGQAYADAEAVPFVPVPEDINFFVEKTTSYCNGHYLKWLNSFGGWSYWLFYKGNENLQTKELGVLNNDFNNLEDTVSPVISLGTESQNAIALLQEGITKDEMLLLRDLLDSAKVYMFTGIAFTQSSDKDWIEVIVKSGNFRLSNARERLNNLSLTIELPMNVNRKA